MAILIYGIHLGKQVLVVALGIARSWEKHVLGLWQGATENTTVVKELLEDLVALGLSTERRYLFVIDGAKALRAAIERVFGERSEVQRCQIHKRRNVRCLMAEPFRSISSMPARTNGSPNKNRSDWELLSHCLCPIIRPIVM